MTPNDQPNPQADCREDRRKPCFVCGAFRQSATGDPIYPVPDSHANCWIIINEVIDPEMGLTLLVVGQFITRDMAEWICDLILQNRPPHLI